MTVGQRDLASVAAEVAVGLPLGDNDRRFLARVYRDGLQKYERRVAAIGMTGRDAVLDFGCGFGQWSLALSRHNAQVVACDRIGVRSVFVTHLASALGVDNLQVAAPDPAELGTGQFDAAFLYSVLPCVDWRAMVRELHRVIRPGGTLYANANAVGWYAYLWAEAPNRADDYDPRAVAARAFADTLRYAGGAFEVGMNLIIEPQALVAALHAAGFASVELGDEGHLRRDPETPPDPFLPGSYAGLPAVYEVLAVR